MAKKSAGLLPRHALRPDEVWRQLAPEFQEGEAGELAHAYLRAWGEHPSWGHDALPMVRASTLIHTVSRLRAQGLDDPRTPPEEAPAPPQ